MMGKLVCGVTALLIVMCCFGCGTATTNNKIDSPTRKDATVQTLPPAAESEFTAVSEHPDSRSDDAKRYAMLTNELMQWFRHAEEIRRKEKADPDLEQRLGRELMKWLKYTEARQKQGAESAESSTTDELLVTTMETIEEAEAAAATTTGWQKLIHRRRVVEISPVTLAFFAIGVFFAFIVSMAIMVQTAKQRAFKRPAEETVDESDKESLEAERCAGTPAERRAEPPVERRAEPPVEIRAEPPVERSAGPSVERRAEPPVERYAGSPVERSAGPSVERRAEPSVERRAEVPGEGSGGASGRRPTRTPAERPARVAVKRCARPPAEPLTGLPVKQPRRVIVEQPTGQTAERSGAMHVKQPAKTPVDRPVGRLDNATQQKQTNSSAAAGRVPNTAAATGPDSRLTEEENLAQAQPLLEGKQSRLHEGGGRARRSKERATFLQTVPELPEASDEEEFEMQELSN